MGTADAAVLPTPVQRNGIIHWDTGAHRWAILSTPPFQATGLTAISCSSSTGKLTAGFVPLRTISTFTVDEDDAYSGRYAAGAAVTGTGMTIVIHKSSTGAVVPCGASELHIADSGLQLSVTGTEATAPPTTVPTSRPPTTEPTTSPTTRPTTTGPTAPPPTSATPTPSGPDEPPTSDDPDGPPPIGPSSDPADTEG